jgi:dTDP-4-dehydrorhamnose 3,5-epimerase
MSHFEVVGLAIDAVRLIRPRRIPDARGYFAETWNQRGFAEAGIDTAFVQDNYSYSRAIGTVRGLHYQRQPRAQAKLVRVARGAIFDVAVDLRRGSPSFGKHVSVNLSAEDGSQLFLPVGFAHGFCTLEPDTEVAYKISEFYSPEHDTGILWNDPGLGIDWPLGGTTPVLSDKDQKLPRLAEIAAPF